jgi:hypothetical protein
MDRITLFKAPALPGALVGIGMLRWRFGYWCSHSMMLLLHLDVCALPELNVIDSRPSSGTSSPASL